jgi:uroporphyrinogen decarboxylase
VPGEWRGGDTPPRHSPILAHSDFLAAGPYNAFTMSPLDRVQAVLAGRLPDRPPFSFWYHFPPEQSAGPAALDAHLNHLKTWQPDFLKVMNDNPYPHAHPIAAVEDLASLGPLRGNEEGFGRQLDLLADLRRQVDAGERLYLTTTVFNAWTVLRQLVQPPTIHRPPNLDAQADVPSRWIRQAYAVKPELVAAALRTIGANLARFAGRCVQAGADGVFLSVRDDWVDPPQAAVAESSLYARLVRPTDLEILGAAATSPFNMLHVCGKSVDFRAFGQYPVAAVSWADRAAGPSIAEVAGWLRPAICAGVDNLKTLPGGLPADIEREVRDALRQAGSRPMIVAPGCTFDPESVPSANLEALAKAVRGD